MYDVDCGRCTCSCSFSLYFSLRFYSVRRFYLIFEILLSPDLLASVGYVVLVVDTTSMREHSQPNEQTSDIGVWTYMCRVR